MGRLSSLANCTSSDDRFLSHVVAAVAIRTRVLPAANFRLSDKLGVIFIHVPLSALIL